METIIKEKYLKDYPLPISIEKIYTIIEQMKYCVCKIFLKEFGTGTGFFCKIPYEKELFPVLITNYHIIDDKYLEENKEIHCSINNNEKNLIIKIDNRKIYLNKRYDIAIIEIKEHDDINYYLELDDNLFKENIEFSYEGNTIYDIQYIKSDNVSVSFGIIKEIKNYYDIIHLCSTDSGSSGSPILNIATNKVIGIHKEASNIFNFNKGTFLKIPINEYIEKNINISKNQMNYSPNLKIQESIPLRLFRTLNNENFEFEEVFHYKYNYNIYFGCWNEVLKCLCFIDEFFNYFKNNKFITKNDSFLSLFKNIIENMAINNNYDNKYKFSKVIYFGKIFKKEKNNSIKYIIDELWLDPYYLIIFILNSLHEELKTMEKKNYFNSINKEISKVQKKFSIPDTENEKIIKESNTFIADLFYGIEMIERKERKVYNYDGNYGSYYDKKTEFEILKIQSYKKYENYYEFENENENDDELGMTNPIFRIMSYKGPKNEIIDKSDTKYNLILTPKILIHTCTNKLLLDFNYGGYDYSLIGLIGSELDDRRYSTEIVNIEHLGDYDYTETYTEYHTYDIYHFFCICKESKTNKWFKYYADKIEEIKIEPFFDECTNKRLFPYNNIENKKEINMQQNQMGNIYHCRYELLIYKKVE